MIKPTMRIELNPPAVRFGAMPMLAWRSAALALSLSRAPAASADVCTGGAPYQGSGSPPSSLPAVVPFLKSPRWSKETLPQWSETLASIGWGNQLAYAWYRGHRPVGLDQHGRLVGDPRTIVRLGARRSALRSAGLRPGLRPARAGELRLPGLAKASGLEPTEDRKAGRSAARVRRPPRRARGRCRSASRTAAPPSRRSVASTVAA